MLTRKVQSMKHRQLIGCLVEGAKFKDNMFADIIPVDAPATALRESAQKVPDPH